VPDQYARAAPGHSETIKQTIGKAKWRFGEGERIGGMAYAVHRTCKTPCSEPSMPNAGRRWASSAARAAGRKEA